MKKTFLVLTFVLISALALSAFAPLGSARAALLQATATGGTGTSSGSGTGTGTGTGGTTTQSSAPSPFFLSQVLGLDLRGRRSAVYGQVHGFVVDPSNGQILYVVASTNGPQGSALFTQPGIGVTGANQGFATSTPGAGVPGTGVGTSTATTAARAAPMPVRAAMRSPRSRRRRNPIRT
jgi:hypothetical protein